MAKCPGTSDNKGGESLGHTTESESGHRSALWESVITAAALRYTDGGSRGPSIGGDGQQGGVLNGSEESTNDSKLFKTGRR